MFTCHNCIDSNPQFCTNNYLFYTLKLWIHCNEHYKLRFRFRVNVEKIFTQNEFQKIGNILLLEYHYKFRIILKLGYCHFVTWIIIEIYAWLRVLLFFKDYTAWNFATFFSKRRCRLNRIINSFYQFVYPLYSLIVVFDLLIIV